MKTASLIGRNSFQCYRERTRFPLNNDNKVNVKSSDPTISCLLVNKSCGYYEGNEGQLRTTYVYFL